MTLEEKLPRNRLENVIPEVIRKIIEPIDCVTVILHQLVYLALFSKYTVC